MTYLIFTILGLAIGLWTAAFINYREKKGILDRLDKLVKRRWEIHPKRWESIQPTKWYEIFIDEEKRKL